MLNIAYVLSTMGPSSSPLVVTTALPQWDDWISHRGYYHAQQQQKSLGLQEATTQIEFGFVIQIGKKKYFE